MTCSNSEVYKKLYKELKCNWVKLSDIPVYRLNCSDLEFEENQVKLLRAHRLLIYNCLRKSKTRFYMPINKMGILAIPIMARQIVSGYKVNMTQVIAMCKCTCHSSSCDIRYGSCGWNPIVYSPDYNKFVDTCGCFPGEGRSVFSEDFLHYLVRKYKAKFTYFDYIL